MIAQFGKDLEWFSFYARYCAGKNIEKPFCRDFEWWALGIAVLVAAIVAGWILSRLSRTYRNWAHKRMLAKVADAETMNKYRWSGPDLPNAKPSSEQRAGRSEKR
jgi:hypothetical protein